MSGGPKRNPDKLNTIGVVVVGICGAVLVYVTIVALEAFYVNDTSDIQTMRDYGGQDTTQLKLRADQLQNLQDKGAPNGVSPGSPQTYRIPIESAMKLVVRDKDTPERLSGPGLPPAIKQPAAIAPPSANPGPGSAAPPVVRETSTGIPGEPQPVAGAGGAPQPNTRTATGSGGHAP